MAETIPHDGPDPFEPQPDQSQEKPSQFSWEGMKNSLGNLYHAFGDAPRLNPVVDSAVMAGDLYNGNLGEGTAEHPSSQNGFQRGFDVFNQVVNPFAGKPSPETERDLETGLPLTGMFAGPLAKARDLDPLGYYSGALEAAKNLPQAKGTPEQMLAQLKKGGAKEAEIAATGLPQLLEGKRSITRDEIINHLNENRVGLRESFYGDLAPEQQRDFDEFNRLSKFVTENGGPEKNPAETARVKELYEKNKYFQYPQTKWSSYSLDPNNPTYRETVLHLPPELSDEEINELRSQRDMLAFNDPRRKEINDRINAANANQFQSGHFPEPNIVGHMMTSLVKDPQGRTVYNVDQIQSDWGQRLRDKGVRDEAKIAELRKSASASLDRLINQAKRANELVPKSKRINIDPENGSYWIGDLNRLNLALGDENIKEIERGPLSRKILGEPNEERIELRKQLAASEAEYRRLFAELGTAEAATPGHPLVNTTDQWTNTTLRKAIQQAVESGAHSISIPSGKTVLGYNPGNEHGMTSFYGGPGERGIVLKNLGKILKTYDPVHPGGQYVEKLETPTRGAKGEGFTVFPITDTVKKSVTEQGHPLFNRGGAVQRRTEGGAASPLTLESIGGRQAEDGRWYLPDPYREGRWLEVRPAD